MRHRPSELAFAFHVSRRASKRRHFSTSHLRNAACPHFFLSQATHIFDGLEDWPTHVLYASHGVIGEAVVVQSDPNLSHGRILSWVLPRLARDDAVEKDAGDTLTHVGAWNNGYASGRLVSTRKE